YSYFICIFKAALESIYCFSFIPKYSIQHSPLIFIQSSFFVEVSVVNRYICIDSHHLTPLYINPVCPSHFLTISLCFLFTRSISALGIAYVTEYVPTFSLAISLPPLFSSSYR